MLGGPGAGKGTQCEKLVQDYGFVHLSVRVRVRVGVTVRVGDGVRVDGPSVRSWSRTAAPVLLSVRLPNPNPNS